MTEIKLNYGTITLSLTGEVFPVDDGYSVIETPDGEILWVLSENIER